MENIKKELDDNQTVLLMMPGSEYNDHVVSVMKELSGSICYVTLNKTYDSLRDTFKKAGINTEKIVFIDAISKTIRDVPNQTDGCYFVSNPGSLTEIAILVDKFLKHDYNYLVFDSLTNMLIYEKRAPVSKFVSSLVNKIRNSKTRAVFYALSVQEQQALIEESSMFVDKVIKTGN